MNLERWIAREWDHAAQMMLKSISATGIVKRRPHFGQVIVPKPGSVVASPVLASYDPDPDYFFHWYRDSAAVMDALWLLKKDYPPAERLFADFVRFSLSLADLDGRKLAPNWRDGTSDDYLRFLRVNAADAHGAAIPGETRVNPDGTLDITDWPRPQYDGPALRALTLLNWGAEGEAAQLLRNDLAFVMRHAGKPCYDIWEEEKGLHLYTVQVSAACLEAGANWLAQRGETGAANACRAEARRLNALLDEFWRAEEACFCSRQVEGGAPEKMLDMAIILAANHAGVQNDRYRATLAKLTGLFDELYAINRRRPSGQAPAMGRYRGDSYYSGGAYYFSTLGAAEFHYRASDAAQGDAFLETVRAFTPESGDLSEQFDQTTGEQSSARHLAWSYAAFLTAVAARRRLLGTEP